AREPYVDAVGTHAVHHAGVEEDLADAARRSFGQAERADEAMVLAECDRALARHGAQSASTIACSASAGTIAEFIASSEAHTTWVAMRRELTCAPPPSKIRASEVASGAPFMTRSTCFARVGGKACAETRRSSSRRDRPSGK